MYFRQYGESQATLKEWSRQLGIASNSNYPLKETPEQTLEHWKNILNTRLETNTFSTYNSAETTIHNWQEKLNRLYN